MRRKWDWVKLSLRHSSVNNNFVEQSLNFSKLSLAVSYGLNSLVTYNLP